MQTQLWIAISVYVLMALIKKQLRLEASLYTLLQILSINAFEQIIECKHERDTDTALSIIDQEGGSFDLIILDNALPPGKNHTSEQTDAGTSTGSLRFDQIQKKYPKVPILIQVALIKLTTSLRMDICKVELRC